MSKSSIKWKMVEACRCKATILHRSLMSTTLMAPYSHNLNVIRTTVSILIMQTLAPCSVCGKGPFTLSNLYKHLRKKHHSTEEEVNEVKLAVKRAFYAAEKKCEICEKTYFSEGGFLKHKKTHGEVVASTSNSGGSKVECPECHFICDTTLALCNHCQLQHSDSGEFAVREEKFSSWDEFESWLSNQEKETISKLVLRHTRKSSKGNIYMYICNRARGRGDTVNEKEYRKRYVIPKRVLKNCPCFVKAHVRGDGLITVTSCFEHLGHEVTAAFLPLSRSDEERVVSLLSMELPFQTVVAKLRAEWNPDEDERKQPRTCYITLRDICNIASRRGLVEGRSSNDDRLSFKTLLSHDEIAAYKLIDTEQITGDGFMLAFITVKGRSYLEQYGNRGVVCDDTFNVTKYSFRLATLLVTDDSGNGFPCAHVLSYRMTSVEMENLFQLVKQLVPGFDPQYFMSDDTLTFFNAFKTVFPYSRAKKVLCCFHVLQIFKRKHKELLKAEFLPTAEKLIRAILFDVDKVNFENGFAAYMTWLVNIGASDMLAYVERNFSGRRDEWALCYRKRAPFTSSNHAESFHNLFKHVTLGGKQSNRLDTVIYALIKLSQNRHLQLLSMSVRGGANSKRWKENVARHKQALISYGSNSADIVQQDENTWEVKAKSGDTSFTVRIDGLCDCHDKLNSHCARCGVCAYEVSCNCVEGYKCGVSCKHAHAVMTFVQQARAVVHSRRQRTQDVSLPETIDFGDVVDAAGDSQENQENIAPEDVSNIDSAKEAFHAVEGAQAQLAEISRIMLKNSDVGALRELHKGIQSLIAAAPHHIRQPFVRRIAVQTSGPAPSPPRIQPFKTRNALNAEKRRNRSNESEAAEWAKRILKTERMQLLTCFICGKRDPEDEEENVYWMSCSNDMECKAWAHVKCSEVGELCSICKKGHWRHEEV